MSLEQWRQNAWLQRSDVTLPEIQQRVQSQMVSRRDLCNGFSAHGLGQIGC